MRSAALPYGREPVILFLINVARSVTGRDRSGVRRGGILVRDRSRDPAVRLHPHYGGVVRHTEAAVKCWRVCAPAVIDRHTVRRRFGCVLASRARAGYDIRTGIRSLDHMLELMTRHGAFDLEVRATGDLDVDQHHTVEDLGITLGEAVSEALGTRRGINRAGYFITPMDETLAVAAVDLGGRPHAVVDLALHVERVGDLQSELIHDFFEGFAQGVRGNIHMKVRYGRSSHLHVEAAFRAFGRARRVACARDKQVARTLRARRAA